MTVAELKKDSYGIYITKLNKNYLNNKVWE